MRKFTVAVVVTVLVFTVALGIMSMQATLESSARRTPPPRKAFAGESTNEPDEYHSVLTRAQDEGVEETPSRQASTKRGSSRSPGRKPLATAKQQPSLTRKPGREKVDHSHHGLVPDAEGVNHAWSATDADRCHGAKPIASCVSNSTLRYLSDHVLLAIITGREDTFRVEVSQCTWLHHFPASNAYVVTDVVPSVPMTPQRWLEGKLPPDVIERDGDLFSPHVKKGYVKAVRSAGQGYSAAWIIAQFRFPWALSHMAERFQKDPKLRWALLVDDDTLVNLDHLVKRLAMLDHAEPWYLSRKGWGGAGHVYSREAMSRVSAGMGECVDRWMIRQFRASDAMLLKCAGHLKLKMTLEPTMSHCPASHLRERILDKDLATLHAKKDMYPPVLLATWRSALYYYASLCRSRAAADLAIEYSACAFGSCKSAHCDKAADEEKRRKWLVLSRNETLHVLPFPSVG
jgi:hypothetical protein